MSAAFGITSPTLPPSDFTLPSELLSTATVPFRSSSPQQHHFLFTLSESRSFFFFSGVILRHDSGHRRDPSRPPFSNYIKSTSISQHLKTSNLGLSPFVHFNDEPWQLLILARIHGFSGEASVIFAKPFETEPKSSQFAMLDEPIIIVVGEQSSLDVIFQRPLYLFW